MTQKPGPSATKAGPCHLGWGLPASLAEEDVRTPDPQRLNLAPEAASLHVPASCPGDLGGTGTATEMSMSFLPLFVLKYSH